MSDSEDLQLGDGYTGRVSAAWQSEDFLGALAALPQRFESAEEVLSDGRNRILRLQLPCHGENISLAVKRFARQSPLKDMDARRRGSKARRSWRYAEHLQFKHVGTPEPAAVMEKWQGNTLAESYYLSRDVSGQSNFRDELLYLYYDHPDCISLMNLLETVAKSARRMHDAGFFHGDFGNQNILLRRTSASTWDQVMFIDLNRGGLRDAISMKERAFDISRITLPSDFLRVFIEMYWGDVPPKSFLKAESRFRAKFDFHTRTRYIRHPFKTRPVLGEGQRDYPHPRDIWIWDTRSAQPIIVMRSKERKKYYPGNRFPALAKTTLQAMPSVKKEYRRLLDEAFSQPVDLQNRIGVAMCPAENREQEKQWLGQLGPLPVLIRFYHHESPEDWERGIAWVSELKHLGHPVSICLVQDRQAVLNPDSWVAFVGSIVDRLHAEVEWVEVGHAINRVKWGLWDLKDYKTLAEPVFALNQKYPELRLIGPAVIDFEYPYTLVALDSLPDTCRFHAIGHHLYVDRRGAPENRQGKYGSLEKFALGRAIAAVSPRSDDRLIISEVNWPIAGTGVYSPVGAPYVSPGPRFDDPSVSEEDYAAFMIRYLVLALCSGLVEQVNWWRLAAHGYGLIDDLDPEYWRKRPAFKALAIFIKYLGQSRFIRKHAVEEGAWLLEFESGVHSYYLAWSHPDAVHMSLPQTCVWSLTIFDIDQKGPIRAIDLDGVPVILQLAKSASDA
jgi:hypothetical protein